jgi:gliding motility-associated-like protein
MASDEVVIEIQELQGDSLQAILGPDELCLGNAATIPVKVNKFKKVANFRLMLNYNVDKLNCEGYTNSHPALIDNLDVTMNAALGEIVLEWHSDVEVTFDVIETITELVFTTLEPGQGQLEWYANASDSYFTNLEGNSIPAEFYAGKVTIYDPPTLFLPNILPVCEGQPVAISGIAQGTHPPLSYLWTYPGGYTTTVEPSFDSVTKADAGIYTLLVVDALGCTDQKSIQLIVYDNPVALFHGIDTMQVRPEYILEAGPGMVYYYWNTGETTESIIITEQGWYSVEMINEAGCTGIDSVFMEIIRKCIDIPNAFTPNGDGLNDIFEAESVCPIVEYEMLIYNRWGELLFESNDIALGWDGKKNGKDCPGDSYVYIVKYIVEKSPGVQEKNVVDGILYLLK